MSADRFRIILGRCRPKQQKTVSVGFARLFGIEQPLADQIVQAAPIVVLSNLSRDQAMEIVQALQELRASGGDLRIEISDDRSISQVAWPSPPKVAGRPLSEYERRSPSGELVFSCPECGTQLVLAVSRHAPAKTDPPKQTAPASGGDEVEVQQGDVLEDADDMSTGLTPLPGQLRGAAGADEEDKDLLGNVEPLAAETPSGVVGDLEEFETGLREAVSDLEQKTAPADHGSARRKATAKAAPDRQASQKSRQSGRIKREPGEYNVVLPKTGNPQAIPLLMQDLGVDEEAARAEMKKPLIAAAKGVSRECAIQVAARYKRIGLNPRVGRKRP